MGACAAPPGPAAALALATADCASVSLQWSAPEDDGGAEIKVRAARAAVLLTRSERACVRACVRACAAQGYEVEMQPAAESKEREAGFRRVHQGGRAPRAAMAPRTCARGAAGAQGRPRLAASPA